MAQTPPPPPDPAHPDRPHPLYQDDPGPAHPLPRPRNPVDASPTPADDDLPWIWPTRPNDP